MLARNWKQQGVGAATGEGAAPSLCSNIRILGMCESKLQRSIAALHFLPTPSYICVLPHLSLLLSVKKARATAEFSHERRRSESTSPTLGLVKVEYFYAAAGCPCCHHFLMVVEGHTVYRALVAMQALRRRAQRGHTCCVFVACALACSIHPLTAAASQSYTVE